MTATVGHTDPTDPTDPTGPTGPTETNDGTDPSWRAWRTSRRPVVIAVALVVAVTAAGFGLRWWGPINPEVVVSDVRSVPDRRVTFLIANVSHAPIAVESIVIHPLDGPEGAAGPTVATDTGGVVIPGGSTGEVSADVPVCGRDLDAESVGATIEIRSSAGRTISIDHRLALRATCRVQLPPPGEQPADPELARAGVTSAFWTVYDSSRPNDERLAAIDDPHGIAEAYASALAQPTGVVLPVVRVDVREVVFDRPEHAWVSYGLAYSALATPITGQAVLVDGTWKVTRSTVCADLFLADHLSDVSRGDTDEEELRPGTGASTTSRAGKPLGVDVTRRPPIVARS